MARNNTSYSEVNSFKKCEQLWFNTYVLKLRKKGVGAGPLAFGKLGHLWLEHYYRILMETTGSNVASQGERMKAIGVANLELIKAFATENYDQSIQPQLMKLLVEYVKTEANFQFDILAVEKSYGDVLPREDVIDYEPGDPDNIYVHMRLDLLIRPRKGAQAGKIGVMDHKFSENFPSPIAVKMNAQLPKQIHTLRENGVDAEFGILNYLRTRQMKSPSQGDLFKREYVFPNDARVNNMMRDHEKKSRQIIYLKNIPVAEAAEKVTKVADPLFCGSRSDRECEFFSLCNLELNGEDTESTIEAFYRKRGRD